MRERVEAMKAIWTQDEASYHGEYVSFDRIWSWPKPAQRPHPPVLVGGDGPDRARPRARLRRRLVPQLAAATASSIARAELRARAERPIEVQVISVPADAERARALRRAPASAGVVHWLPSAPRGAGRAGARALGGRDRRVQRGA